GGMEALDEPYTTIPLLRMVKKRATWLIVLFLGEMLTATAMQGYNGEIEKAAILAMFLPLIISSGGNSGSQATTLVIRAMALGELGLRDWFRVVRKELLSGLSLGLILGTIGFFRISLWQYLHIFDYGQYHWLVAVTVGAALIGVVLWGTISGAMLPFLLRRLVRNLAEFAESRREDKRITQQLTEELTKTFITSLEREDIQALAASLYKIPKTVEKIGERMLICPQDLPTPSFAKQVQLLDQAAEA